MTALQRPLFTDTRTRAVNLELELSDVYCGRPKRGKKVEECHPGEAGFFGNPFDVRVFPDALERFRTYLLARVEQDRVFRRCVLALKGKRLGCFCVRLDGSGDCHAKIIAQWIEAQTQGAPRVP